jgi:sigma-B regulation protein RsbU (phosphoserine phosphatase)
MLEDSSQILAILFFLFQGAILVLILILLAQIQRLTKQRDILLQEKDVVLNFVYDIGEVFAETDAVDVGVLLKRVVYYAQRTTGASSGVLYLLEPDDETLRAQAVGGVFPPLSGRVDEGIGTAFSKIRYVERLVRRETIKVGEGLVGEVMARGLPTLIENAESDARVPCYTQDFLVIHSLLLVPMRFRHKVIGVLGVVNRTDGKSFSHVEMNLLQALADQASVSVHYAKFSAALDEKRRLDYDLGVAKRIQTTLLPKDVPQIEGVDLAAFSVPAQQIGGDYYDFVDVDENHVGIVIADVSGKGISGAIVMSICRSVLRVEAPGCLSPSRVLKKVNRVLSRDLSEDMFVSILYMILNTRTHELVLSRGGHVYPILNAGSGIPSMIKSEGIAMGLADTTTFDEVLEEKSVTLRPGDIVVAYTDGVTEAQDCSENEWGILNLVKAIQTTALEGSGAGAVASNVRQKLLQFVGETPQYDDMTLVVLRAVR